MTFGRYAVPCDRWCGPPTAASIEGMAEAASADPSCEPTTVTGVARAEVRETHTGIVVLVGDRAYKVKKPVQTDFLDFRSQKARELVCTDEVRLNSRLAPTSYLGVGHFASPEGGDEPVVVMRRYPESRRLSTLAQRSEPVDSQLTALATTLARFHRAAERSDVVDRDARPSAQAQRWDENLTVLAGYAESVVNGDDVAEARRLASSYLEGRITLLNRRIRDRRIIDGHGDLLATDIFCMPEGAVVLDCLEFDDHLRHVDGLDDAAFLAMDFEFLGRPDLATSFLADYRRFAEDDAPTSLAHFYIAYRAVVRAKVDCIRVDQGVVDAVADARRHLALAVDHLRLGAVQLVMVGGGPGSGKTTLSGELALRIGAAVVSTDDVRRDLVELGALTGEAGILGAGRYDGHSVGYVYDEMLRRARTLLGGGQSVVLDGTWRAVEGRRAARDLAEELRCSFVQLVCVCDEEDALERIRLRTNASHSEVTPQIAASIYQEGMTWPEATPVDTRQPLLDSVVEAAAACRRAV